MRYPHSLLRPSLPFSRCDRHLAAPRTPAAGRPVGASARLRPGAASGQVGQASGLARQHQPPGQKFL